MKPFVRILIVTEDWPGSVKGGFLPWKEQPLPAARTSGETREFYLGEFIQVLEKTPWVGFDLEITKAHRAIPGTRGLDEADLKADRGCDVVGFRFDKGFTVKGQNRVLADYDIALYFAIDSRNPDPALASEAEAIALFMENGKGFFATGDHANLGAQLCGLIPRVRSMRRWWYPASTPDFPPAPSGTGAERLDTTRPGRDKVVNFEDQSDDVPQEITPTFYNTGDGKEAAYAITALPHPLLCSPEGVVRYLPDHMHEGMCEVPDNLATRMFTLGGTTVREYPDYTPPAMPPSYVPRPLAPDIVATAKVIAGVMSPALEPGRVGGAAPAVGVSFGAIAAWDGYRVGKGRVVVDSTFHHFFDINLTGDRYLEDNVLGPQDQQKLYGFYVPDGAGGRVPNDEYKMIMWYYRNIVYWLIPADKQKTIWWQSLNEMAVRSVFAEELLTKQLPAQALTERLTNMRLEHYLYFGHLAESYFKQVRGACSILKIKQDLYLPTYPWGLWIRKLVDLWEPVAEAQPPDIAKRGQLAGVLGTGPRPEVIGTLGLGAALVTVAALRTDLANGVDSENTVRLLHEAWSTVLGHAAGELRKSLNVGLEMHNELQKLIDEQTRGNQPVAANPDVR